MKRTLILSAVVFLVLFFYRDFKGKMPGSSTVRLQDVTQKTILTIRQEKDQKSGRALSLYIFGRLDGTAVLREFYEGKEIRSFNLGPGPLSVKRTDPWPYPKCSLRYEPGDVRSGNVGIRYKFGE
jgi:hypothetical protein